MANRVVLQDGYKLPFSDFEGYKRRRKSRRSRRGGRSKQANKMRACAKRWRASGRKGSYRAFMKRCL
jgi:hypothetical protein